METIVEKNARKYNGFIFLFIVIAGFAAEFFLFKAGIQANNTDILWIFIPLLIILFVLFGGFMIIQPNDSRVLIFFGKYLGTVRDSGFWFVNPLTTKKLVSLRIHNLTAKKLK